VWDLVGWAGNGEGAGVEPLQEPLEDFGFLFREADGLVEAFGESGVESRGEKGAGSGEEFSVDEVGEGWAGGVFLVADDDRGHCAESSESGAQRDFGWGTARSRA
jgi:hypothetical protein